MNLGLFATKGFLPYTLFNSWI